MGSSGGSSGGGGSSGSVDYPTYLKEAHQDWLNHTGVDFVSKSIVDVLNEALDNSPFFGLSAYDPASNILTMRNNLDDIKTLVNALDWELDFEDVYAKGVELVDTYINPETRISSVVSAHTNMLESEFNSKIYPLFEAGMRDAGAVMTSAFVIGRAMIADELGSKLDKFAAELRMQAEVKRADMINQAVSEMLRILVQKVELTRAWAAMTIDTERLIIAAYGDQNTEDKAIDVADAKWNLELWQYGANLLAAIGGGTAVPQKMEGNQMARIIGGGLSGASAGALIGSRVGGEGGYGGLIGAGIGGIAGLLGGMSL